MLSEVTWMLCLQNAANNPAKRLNAMSLLESRSTSQQDPTSLKWLKAPRGMHAVCTRLLIDPHPHWREGSHSRGLQGLTQREHGGGGAGLRFDLILPIPCEYYKCSLLVSSVRSGTRSHRLSDFSHGRFPNRLHDDFLQFLLDATDTLLFDYDPFHSAVLLQQRCQVVMFF